MSTVIVTSDPCKIILSPISCDAVYPEWWHGGDDFAPALQAALNCAYESGISKVSLAQGTFELHSTVYLRYGVTLAGAIGGNTVFVPVGNITPFMQNEDFPASSYWTLAHGFTIDASENENDIDLMYFNRHFCMVDVGQIKFLGNPDAAQRGLHLYHTDPDGRMNGMYHNRLRQLYLRNCLSENGALHLEGSGHLLRRANNNLITECKFDLYRIGVHIGGIGNLVTKSIFNPPSDPVLLDGSGGRDLRVVFYDGYANAVRDNWVELGATDVVIQDRSHGGRISVENNVGIRSINQLMDLCVPIGSAYRSTAYYSAADTLTIVGDVTTYYPVGARVWADCGDDGWRPSTVESVSYSSPDTTITLVDSVLTANLETITPSHVVGANYCLDFHGGRKRHCSNLSVGGHETDSRFIVQHLKGRCRIDPGSIAAGDLVEITFPAEGVTKYSVVNVSSHVITTGLIITGAYTQTDNAITVGIYNPTGSAIDPGGYVYRWTAVCGTGDALEEYEDASTADDELVSSTDEEDDATGEA